MQRTYENLFIVNPDLEESEITKTIETVQDIVTNGGGKPLKVDRWGRRQLAYQIQNKREGYYVLLYFEAPPTLIAELNRRYKLLDNVMRALIVQLRNEQVEDLMQPASLEEPAAEPEPENVAATEEANQENTPSEESETANNTEAEAHANEAKEE